ncbi:MAG: copper resistance protein B [Rhodospirillales bacterium]|nr:copper resistance protein B [Rhodospirillales bacterium]
MMILRRCGMLVSGALLITAAAGQASAQQTPDGAPAGWPEPVMDSQIFTFFMAERNEYQIDDDNQFYVWDAQGWIGGDYNKLWLRTEGEYVLDQGKLEAADLEVLYSRTITPFWDAQIGVRSTFEPAQAWDGVVGVQGLAPYFFEVEATAYVNDEALQFTLEGAYDLLVTQRLIAEPRVEVNLSTHDIERRDVVSGFSELEAGVRLRYEIIREVAPYVGFEYVRDEAAEDDKDSLRFVTGLRLWF